VLPAQELGHFEFDGLLEHELSAQTDDFGEGCSLDGRGEELLFDGLPGELPLHKCLSLSV
jgi:hypothetical protein